MGLEQGNIGCTASPLTVFVSYDRGNSPTAQSFVRALEADGLSVWWDGLLPGGSTYSDRISEALQQADVVLVLWSEKAAQSHWVRDEAAFGRDRNRLVPVTIDGTEAPLGFRQIQTVDMSRWQGRGDAPEFRRLCSSIRSCAGMPATEAPIAGPATPRVSRRMVIAGAAATVAAASAALIWAPGKGSAGPARIAVLPFENLSGDPKQDYFSEGLAEELRSTLSQSEELEVAAQTSSESARQSNSTAAAMAKKLNVAYLVEGSVRRSPSTIRVAARIVNGRTGFDEWSKTFERKLEDSFEVQSDIADFVTDALVAGIRKWGNPQRVGGTRNGAAFDAYLRGSAAYRLAAGDDSDREALRWFSQAAALDPRYAAAHAARSRALTVIANNSSDPAQVAAGYRLAVAAARQAIQIAPDLAEGYSALGFVLFNGQLDARAAQAPYKRSFDLGFGNAEILSAYANFAGRTGAFAEAREAIARAQSLDPLNASVFRNAGLIEYSARDFAAAESQFRSALAINPRASNVHAALGDVALARGDAAAALTQFSEEHNAVSRLRGLAIAEMKLGQAAQAQNDYSAMLREGGGTVHYQQAQVLAQWDRTDDALAQLEQAYAVRDAGLVRMKNDPLLDPVRKNARFTKLEQTIGFG